MMTVTMEQDQSTSSSLGKTTPEGGVENAEISTTVGRNSSRTVKIVLASLLLFLTFWVGVLALDIRRSIKDFQQQQSQNDNNGASSPLLIHEATVNVREAVPVVTAVLTLEMPQPRWSTLMLQHVTCAVPSGRLQANFHHSNNDSKKYSMTATCPVEDVESHAAYLWGVSVGSSSTMAEDDNDYTKNPWFIFCRMEVRVRVGNVLPLTYTHRVEWSERTDHDAKNEAPTQEETNEDPSWPQLVVHEWGPTTLQVRLPLVLWDDEAPPKMIEALEFLVPALAVRVQQQQAAGDGAVMAPALQIALPETTAHWIVTDKKKNETDTSVTPMNELVFYVTCQEETLSTKHCPWYRPISNTLFGSGSQDDPTVAQTTPYQDVFESRLPHDSTTTVSISHLDITVDGQDSFLETVLGQQHTWTVERTAAPDLPPIPFGLDQEFRQQTWSQRRLRSAPTVQEATANCLQVSDGIQTFDVAMCLLVNVSDSNQGNIVTVANMTFYQTSLAGAAISEWTRVSQTLDLSARAVIDDAESSVNPRINATGTLLLETYSRDTEIDANLINEGSWYPMTLSLLTNGTAVNDALTLVLHDATVFVDGQEYLTGATGSLLVDIDQLILQGSLQDPTYQVSVEAEFLEDQIVAFRENPYAPPTPLPTLRPTQAPTVSPTSFPTFSADTTQTFNLYGVQMDLFEDYSSVGFFVSEGMASAFRTVTEDFLTGMYQPNYTAPSGAIITSFGVSFNFAFLDFDWRSGASFVQFAPEIFFASSEPFGETLARALLVAPFEDFQRKQEYLELLRASHPEFATLLDIGVPYSSLWGTNEQDDDLYYGDDLFGPNEPLNGTSVGVFRGDWTILKDGVYIWNSTWLGEFWNYNYYEYIYNPDDFSSSSRDITHSFLSLDWKETVKDIHFEASAIDLYHYGYFYNGTTYESGTTEDFENILLEYIRFAWDSTQYLNMSADLYIDVEAQSFDLKAQDNARADFIGGVGISWLSQDSTGDDIVTLEYWNATNFVGSKPYASMEPGSLGSVTDDGVRGTFNLISGADSWLQVNATFGYMWDEFEEVFLASFDRIAVGWQGDAITDLTGTCTLGIAGEYFGAVLRDTEVAAFFANFSAGWYSNTASDWGFSIGKALLEIGSEVDVDSTASFRYCDVCAESNFNPYGIFYIGSSSAANMQMDMEMNFTWVEDDEYLQVVMDHCRMVWKDTVYVETGILPLSAVVPSTGAPIASPSLGPTASPTSAPTMAPTNATNGPTMVPTSTPTMAPTNSTDGPTTTPTSAPTVTPAITSTEENYEVTGITMRLQGGQQMSPSSVEAFEASVKSFYEGAYASSPTPNQRRLQASTAMINFDTTVKVTDQSVDDTGNTVSYDQNITFTPTQDVILTSDDVQGLLEAPLASVQGRQDLLQVLQDSATAFENVTEVDEVSVPLPVTSGTDRDVDPASFGVRAFGIRWLCVCLLGWLAF
eukprot:scaffold1697_cov180-Amphora_coffeaeformis.AAC.37